MAASASRADSDVEESGGAAESPTWESLGLNQQLCDICREIGWAGPTGIQADAIPWALQGRDIIGLAETGSGKTASFALPVLNALLAAPSPVFALCITPTRELAIQIAQQFTLIGSAIGARTVTVVGGVDMVTQAVNLAKKPHIIVGTPGRIVDHLENTKGFSLRTLKFLVLDEADRILNMDFEEELRTILAAVPSERNTYLFSATMTSKVAKLQRASLLDPVRIEVSTKYSTPKALRHEYLFLPDKRKDCYLAFVLNDVGSASAIVFVSTCKNTQRVALVLAHLGFSVAVLHAKLTQEKRISALNRFKGGSKNILIATDVASRGLDIPSVDLVINYDVPLNSKDYVHRVGRTARAGRAGLAITMVTQYEVELFQRIEALLGKKMELHTVDQAQALLLQERVAEAQAFATTELAESGVAGKRIRYDGDEEDESGAPAAKKHASGPKRGGGRGRGGSRGKPGSRK